MAKNTTLKQQLIKKYKDQISNSKGMYFFNGSLNAAQTQDIKMNLTNGAKLTLIKNTLFNIASKEAELELEATGYNNVIFVEDELIENASKLSKFLSDNELEPSKVVIGKSEYDGKKLKTIAGLGSTTQVQTKLVSILSTPTTMMVRALQSPMQKLVYTLAQIKPN